MTDQKHPLDDCDPAECYQTMMSERTALITARREAEDNLVKTVIQLSAALLTLLAGFISQAKIDLSLEALVIFGLALIALVISITAGLMEHRFSSRAYLEQQKLVEDYYQKKIYEFDEPAANKSVRKAQTIAFVSFGVALGFLGIFALAEAGENYGKSRGHSFAAASTSASTSAAAAPSAATSAAAAPSAATSAAAAPSAATDSVRRRIQGRGVEVSGTEHAASSATQNEVRR